MKLRRLTRLTRTPTGAGCRLRERSEVAPRASCEHEGDGLTPWQRRTAEVSDLEPRTHLVT